MINIKKFVQVRKQKKLSQTELCQGICTQATLSKFENLGRVPSMKILTQLCDRMGISLSDLIDDPNQVNQEVAKRFDQADFSLITYDYEKIAGILNDIDFEPLQQEDQWHYTYLRGTVAVLGENNLIDGLYYFNQILTADGIQKDNIYYILAEAGCGQIYGLQGDLDKAETYYDHVFDVVLHRKIDSDQTAIKILGMLYAGGVFYAQKQDYDTSNSLLNYAYQICSDTHVVYYLARIVYQLALNAKAQHRAVETITDYLADSLAFARLNGNKHLIEEIARVRHHLIARSSDNEN